MKLKAYTVISKEEFKEALKDEEDIEVFTDLDTLLDVYGEFTDYNVIDYEDDNPISYSGN